MLVFRGPAESRTTPSYLRELERVLRGSELLARALEAARRVNLPDWYLAAGAIRNTVWSQSVDGAAAAGSRTDVDVDVVFFDASDRTPACDERALAALRDVEPDLPWEATNQAAIHAWYLTEYGVEVPPLASSEQGIAGFPEIATCVGARLQPDGTLLVVAPHGLDDLRARIWRRNAGCPIVGAFDARIAKKGVRHRWPDVTVVA